MSGKRAPLGRKSKSRRQRTLRTDGRDLSTQKGEIPREKDSSRGPSHSSTGAGANAERKLGCFFERSLFEGVSRERES